MAFISVSDEVAHKSFTSVENKFVTKYLPVLEPVAIKVYIYALYLYQNGQANVSAEDMAEKLSLTEQELKSYFEYLEEFELISILSLSPLEIKILDAENVSGTPKKFKPEKYADFTKNVQNIIKGRMISTNEFREYFVLLEEYGFEQNALIMIISYCVNLKGDNIRLQYIKKVAKSFADEGNTTAKKVNDKLSAYTSSTPALLKIFTAAGISKQPDIDDDKLYKKWTAELGFDDDGIIACAKSFKAKTSEKIDAALEELYRNKKFDVKEIADFCASKNAIYNATLDIARALGVYMQNSAPYIENYVNVWCDYGFSLKCLKQIADYCFKNGKKSFEDAHSLIQKLYGDGIVSDGSVKEYIDGLNAQDGFLKKLLSVCGLSRKVIEWDRQSLANWRSWNFSDDMIMAAAKLSAQKSNPMAYMNSVLSNWKTEGKFSLADVPSSAPSRTQLSRGDIERHYYELRHIAEDRAEKAFEKALADDDYSKIKRDLNELTIQLAFAELQNPESVQSLNLRIKQLENAGKVRLKELGIDEADFTPHYSCQICNDTGYDSNGAPCECMKEFIASVNKN